MCSRTFVYINTMKLPPRSTKVNRLIGNVVRFLARPVVDDFALFATTYLLLLFPSLYNVLSHGCIPFAVFFICFANAYMLLLPTSFFVNWLKRVYKAVVLSLVLIYSCASYVCICAYGSTLLSLGEDAISAILATNVSEATEFFGTYVDANELWVFVVSMIIILLLYFLIRRFQADFKGYFIQCCLLCALLVSSCFAVRDYKSTSYDGINFVLSYKPVPDLREYKQNPSVTVNNSVPENIVMILGESFSKSNSSLYGYEKKTNSRLAQLVADSSLSVFTDITSYTINTIPSIKSIIMGWREELDSIEWYRGLTLLEVMQNAGYKTYWFSNQSKAGIYDNEVGRFADLCDGEYFVGEKFSGLHRNTLDEALLPALDEQLPAASGRNFYIVQMMGSHSDFKRRYPELFAKFTAEDYSVTHSRLTMENRQLLAEYDNSILYNDSIVYEIMERFAGSEAVVFYFSDHALDVFQSSDDYIGHASLPNGVRDNNIFGRLIPFMVYTTPKFRERFPQTEERIKRAVDVSYRTDSIMYTIMDVAGIETVNGISYKQKSLFK